MSDFEIADFDRFRFFRDSDGNIVSLEAQAFGEDLFPVVDCQTFRLARLHLYGQAAKKPDWLEAFETEMEQLSDIDERLVSRPFTWGRDDDELFYVNCMLDGEELPSYLGREGARSPELAAKWLLPFVELIDGDRDCPMSILRFSNRNLQVVRNLETNVAELHFTEFTAWTKPGNLVVERGPEYFLAQSFLSLISGIPLRDFTENSLPKQFQFLPEFCQRAINATFDAETGEAAEELFEQIRILARQHQETDLAPLPESPLRKWIRAELEKLPEAGGLAQLDEQPKAEADLSYSFETEFEELSSMIQLMPGILTIPKEGWLEQHWLVLRRTGRNFANQLAVYDYSENPSISLVTEENPNGIHLRRLVRETGPLSLDHAVAMANRLSSSIDGLEGTSSAAPVWWLPEQNVYVNLGTREASEFSAAIEKEGSEFWERVPFRMRLHQTVLGMLEGVNLPTTVRSLAYDLAKDNPHIRRTTVLLPLIGLLLTGKKFQWDQPFWPDDDSVPEGAVELINRTRLQLVDNPFRLEEGFLSKLTDFCEGTPSILSGKPAANATDSLLEEYAIGAAVGGMGATLLATAGEEEEKDEFQEILDNSLGDDTIDLNSTPEEDDQEFSFLDPRHAGRQADVSDTNLGIVDGPAANQDAADYQPGISHNPIAMDIAKKAKEEELARKKAQQEETRQLAEVGDSEKLDDEVESELDEAIDKIADDEPEDSEPEPGELIELETPLIEESQSKKFGAPKPRVLPVEAPEEMQKPAGLGWCLVILAGLIIGGATGFYIYGNAKHSGIYDFGGEFEFPLTQYEVISPQVNPFTNTLVDLKNQKPPAPISAIDGVTNVTDAIEQSAKAMQSRQFSKAVDLALWGIQLDPDSEPAGGQLEAALIQWIESGIDVPSRSSDPSTINILAEYYISELDNQTAEGLYILMASAGMDNAKAMRIFGLLFGQGKLLPKSPSLAARWLRQAAVSGDRDAQFYYGESSVFGNLVEKNNDGFALLEKAADAGHPRSLLFRGYCSLEGKGIGKDDIKGYQYVSRAAEKGSLEALFQMGLCRAKGVGTEQSDKAAASSFKTAADLGYVPAMFRHAQCQLLGFGTSKSYAEGVSWMKKAAGAGLFEARDWCSQNGTEFESIANQ